MHLVEIKEKGIKLYMPSNLAECDSRQYMEMCELIFRLQQGIISYYELRIQTVYKLLNLEVSKKKLLQADEDNKFSNIYRLSELIDGFFEEVDGKMVIRQDYIHNPVPEFKPLFKNYYGPADGFSNITFGEYTDALRLFLEYSTTGDVKTLYLLAAVLYRPKKQFLALRKRLPGFDGDIRRGYNSRILEAEAERLKNAPFGFIYGAYLLFSSFQKYLTGATVPWAGRELNFSILFDSGTNAEKEVVPGLGMDSLVFALAESGEFGKADDVRRVNIWEIFIRLYDLKKKDMDNKRKEKENAKN